MKEMSCKHPGCNAKHKSTTGYCAEHAEDSAHRRRVFVPDDSHTGRMPSLGEIERDWNDR